MVSFLISLVLMYMVFSVSYVWVRRDNQGERVYPKEIGFYAMVVIGAVLFIVNATILF